MIAMTAWVFTLGLSSGFVVYAAELLADSVPLPSEEFDEAEEHLRLGVDFFLTNELDVAIDEFREASRLQTNYMDAYHNLGVALAKTGDLTGAIAAWTEAERLDPDGMHLPYSLPALVAYNYGVSLVRRGHVQQAMKEWQNALRMQPQFSEAHYALGLGFLALKNPAVAAAHFQSALSLSPDWAEASVALGQAHYESHEYDRAREMWHKALELSPGEARIYALLGHLAVRKGNFQEAIDYVREAIALQSELIPAHFHLGLGHLAKGEIPASVLAFEEVLRVDAHFTPARLWLGVAWSRLGNWARAARHWREALQLDPFGGETLWLHTHLGMALTAMGQVQDATKEFQWVVEQRPEQAEGWSQLGVSLMAERRWGEAVEALHTAIKLDVQVPHFHFALGNAHAEQGELALAIQAFQEAVRLAPDFVDAQFHLGMVLRAHNQLLAAVEPLRHAAEGGSREAQGLLASMYVNGHGIDRNMPLAMLWWSRSSRGAIADTITRTAQNQLAQLRRRLHRQQFTPAERQDVLTGFSLIRQDLANHAPVKQQNESRSADRILPKKGVPSTIVLQWMVERALALDTGAQDTLRKWYVESKEGKGPLHEAAIQDYWLQVAKEGDRMGCELIANMTPQEKFSVVRQACESLN